MRNEINELLNLLAMFENGEISQTNYIYFAKRELEAIKEKTND